MACDPQSRGYRVSSAYDDNPEHDINHCIYDHEDHLYVGIWDPCSCLSEFFVARPEANVFYATWYVDFWRSCAAINQAQQIERAVDAFIAFIRYGHWEQTVYKYGFPG